MIAAFETTWAPRILSVMRMVVGLLLLEHGTQKFLGFPAYVTGGAPAAMSPSWYAGLIELVCGALIAVGFLTRPAAFLASGMTAVAYFMVHAPRSFFPINNGGELAIVYCFVLLYLAAVGGGAWSLDALKRR